MAADSVYNEIMREYAESRRRAENERAQRVRELYRISPELEDVDAALAQFGIEASRGLLFAQGDKSALVAELSGRNAELKARRAALLTALGYTAEYLSPAYECRVCGDTGFDGDSKCRCFTQRLIKKRAEMSGLNKDEVFGSFELRYYSPDANAKMGVSPKANMTRVLGLCQAFVKNFGREFTNILLQGDTGLGKTFLCNCIGNKLLADGNSVIYYSAAELMRMMEERRFDNKRAETEEYYGLTYDCGLLIIDDLGAEFSTSFTDAELFNIINARLLKKRAVVISTNLKHREFIERYSERVSSRIFGNYQILPLFGDDIRQQKKYNL